MKYNINSQPQPPWLGLRINIIAGDIKAFDFTITYYIHLSKYIVYLSVHMPILQVLFHIPALKTYETLKIKAGYAPLH